MTELNFSKKGGEEYFIEVKARATATHYLGEEKEVSLLKGGEEF